MDEKDTASRKWQLTFNNPEEHGWTHDKIREVLRSFKTMAYGCMADEIGAEEKTTHRHLFIRPCLKIGGMPNGERFFRQSRQIFAGGLTPGKKI